MKQTLLIVFLVLSSLVQGQNTLDGTIQHYSHGKVFLLAFYGEKTALVDSTLSDSAGHFSFTFSSFRLSGMYRVQWGKEGLVDLIWNHENIRFVTTRTNPEDSLMIQESVENKINQNYSTLDKVNQTKLQLLMPLVDYYPVKDRFYGTVVQEMEKIQKKQKIYLDSLVKLYPNTYAVRMAKIYQTPFISSSLGNTERISFLKQHYFDNIDFSDTALLRSTVFANKAISYLALYSNNRLQQKQLEAEFIKAVTIMLSAASVNPEIYKFWLDYLVSGFDKYHFDEVITYIADNFQDPYACEDQTRKTALQKKLETFKKLSVGNEAPEVETTDSKGKPVKLSDINSEYTLLVFWSSECSHCSAMMPLLKELYDKQKPKRIEVMAISIDTSRAAWTGFLKENRLNWINGSDLKGFGGKAVDDYNIYATPTMFLLDKQKKILAKPITMRELEQVLRENKLIVLITHDAKEGKAGIGSPDNLGKESIY
ncbi:MAG: redoxin domain-containing protein [Bacteroidales bacterium]|nr:redoxin domain-containing protein [Bacteroidales bacterium]